MASSADRSPSDAASASGRLRPPDATTPSAKCDVSGVEAELLRHVVAQFHAGGVDAGGRVVGAELAARARRYGKIGVAEPDRHLVERQAHHFRRGLGDDRVRAGADVGHVRLDRDDRRACRAAPARRTWSARLLRKPIASPWPTSQRPRGSAPGVGLRLSQPKRSAPRRAHSTSWRTENGRSGSPGRPGFVEDAELERIEPELLRHLVHGDLERHHARRLARRAHGVALGEVERRKCSAVRRFAPA